METKYTTNYLTIFQKLVAHCLLKNEKDILEQSLLSCPKEILEFDVCRKITNYEIIPRLMTEEDNKSLRYLVDKNLDEDSFHDHRIH